MHSSEIEKGVGIFKFVKESGSVLRRATVQALTENKDGFRVTLLLGTGTGTAEYALVDDLRQTAERLLAMGVPVIAKIAHFESRSSTTPGSGNNSNPIKQVVVGLRSAKKFLEHIGTGNNPISDGLPSASKPAKPRKKKAPVTLAAPAVPESPESQVA